VNPGIGNGQANARSPSWCASVRRNWQGKVAIKSMVPGEAPSAMTDAALDSAGVASPDPPIAVEAVSEQRKRSFRHDV
jgi:hypothetical protein